MGKEAVKDLIAALEKAKDPVLVIALLETLGKIGPEPARPALLEVNKRLNNVNPEIKAWQREGGVWRRSKRPSEAYRLGAVKLWCCRLSNRHDVIFVPVENRHHKLRFDRVRRINPMRSLRMGLSVM